jgi:hypothetical protein
MIGGIISGIGSMYAGVSAYKSAFGEASLLEEQGALTRDDYYTQAALVRDEGHRTRAKQTMEYVSAGVEVVGTPLLVLRETLSRSYARASSYEKTGVAAMNLYNRKAQITRNEGKAALISGVLSGAGSMLGGFEGMAPTKGGKNGKG